MDLSGVRDTAQGDYQLADLSKAVNTETANEILVKTWIDRAGEFFIISLETILTIYQVSGSQLWYSAWTLTTSKQW